MKGIARVQVRDHRKFFDSIADGLGIKIQEDWYHISRSEFVQRSGAARRLYQIDSSSFVKSLQSVYSEFLWYPWKFGQTPRNYWKDEKNRREYLEWFGNEVSIQKPEDWYSITGEDIIGFGGSGLLVQFGNSILRTLQSVYKEYEWTPWKFVQVPQKFWNNIKNHRLYLDWLEKQLGITKKEQWYQIKLSEIVDKGARGMLIHHNFSLQNALQKVYSEHDWRPWLFEQSTISSNVWQDFKNHQKFFNWLEVELNLKKEEDWLNLTSNDVKQKGGSGLLELYDNSVANALQTIFPQRFGHLSRSLWADVKKEKQYMDWVAEQLGVEQTDSWYSFTGDDINACGGTEFIRKYDSCLVKALQSVYPDFAWLPWRFEKVPKYYWDNTENQKKFFQWIASEAQVEQPSDWFKLKRETIVQLGGGGILHMHRSLLAALQKLFPECDWVAVSGLSDGQKHVWSLLKGMLNCQVILNYKHPHLSHNDSKQKMEFDIYLPSLELAFEYQGYQHYMRNDHFRALKGQQQRDEEKRAACKSVGISLIEIPFWWNCSSASLINSIQKHRPDFPMKEILRQGSMTTPESA